MTRTHLAGGSFMRRPISRHFIYVLCIFLLGSFSTLQAQDVLVGLTSNGGPEGKGTAYSIKSDGKNFNVIKGFADWGANPVDDLVKGSDGNLYGLTPEGGTYNHGTLFRVSNTGSITILKHFNLSVDGGYPRGSLVQARDGNFYGTVSAGTVNNGGGIFRITPGGQYSVIKSLLVNTEGGHPHGKLVQGSDDNLYGLASSGGTLGYGTIFKITMAGQYTMMKSFTKTDGATPYGGLIQANDGNLYGMTYTGGTTNDGVIFRFTTGGAYTILRSLNDPDGIYPRGDLIQGKDGWLYGITPAGGLYNGTIFKTTLDGKTFSVIKNLSAGIEGGNATGSLFLASDGNFWGMTYSLSGGFGGSIFKMSTAGVVTVVKKLTPATDGSYPMGGLVQGSDGALYGMTNLGGKLALGTIVKITTAHVFSVLTHFNGALMGNTPQDNLAIGKDSAYYGVTRNGGTYNYGTLFKICGGTTTVLRSFNRNVDGGNPMGGLVKGKDGNIYGTTETGGTNGSGTIFKWTAAGQFSVLRHLKSATDGGEIKGTMIVGLDSALYGMTYSGGTGTGGTIFRITTGGSFSVLRHLVPATDGNYSEGGLVEGTDGSFYGLTGYNSRFFRITKGGLFTVLKTLVSGSDGSGPAGNMVRASDGFFYGTMATGGTYGKGVIFKISTAGAMTKMRHLNGTSDGGNPKGGLVIGTDGAFYGTASTGGSSQAGTIFRITNLNAYSILKNFNITSDGSSPQGGLVMAPKISLVANAQANLATTEDVAKSLTLTGTGAVVLNYNIAIPPRHGSMNSGTASARTYTPFANYSGKDSFAFTVSVGCITSTPAWVTFNITAVNDAPVLAFIGNKTVAPNTQLKFTAFATDVDAGQTKTFSLVTPPTGALISSTTGAFTWTPTTTGSFIFKVKVTDNGSPVLFDDETITVTVAAPPAGLLPAAEENPTMRLHGIKGMSPGIYPNPVTEQFKIVLGSNFQEVKLSIFSTDGSMVYSRTHNGSSGQLTVNATQLKAGAYTVQVETTAGVSAHRMVKL
ncbi:MAG: T9SS type A sorting domain-containing protein [Ferruginibacter sp.]|nr:T9SS type A sorting domain-containing protein [Ferruginibacter sp.]